MLGISARVRLFFLVGELIMNLSGLISHHAEAHFDRLQATIAFVTRLLIPTIPIPGLTLNASAVLWAVHVGI
jgi:hypothetical protein